MFFETNRFFKEHKKKTEYKTMNYLYRNLTFSQCDKGDSVFKYGEMGKLFYIILEGEVIVKTPGPHLLEGDQEVNANSVLLYLIKYFRDIDWTKLVNGDLVHRLLLGELDKMYFEVDKNENFDKKEVMAKLLDMIEQGKTKLHEKVFKMINPDRKRQLTITRFKEVTRLFTGCSFGELALLKTRGRAATIECELPSKFAVLDQRDFLHAVGMEENRKLKETVAFYRSFRIFQKVKPMDM